MNALQPIGRLGICEQSIYLIELNAPSLPHFVLPSRHFACLRVAEFSADAVPLIRSLMARGAAYITAWGRW